MLPLDKTLAEIASSGTTPRILLHCCCAPCASSVLEYLSPLFRITMLLYNPNILPREEHDKRNGEFQKLLSLASLSNDADVITAEYDAAVFQAAAMPFWDEPEGGMRCRACIGLRLEETAARAKAGRYDYFATTLTVSPHKNAALINDIGDKFDAKYSIKYLRSDFKKRDGYKRSIELSKQYSLYRQPYCGCKPAGRMDSEF